MKCPNCEIGIIEVGADGNTYCPECMSIVENAEFSILSENMLKNLDEFYDDVDPDDRGMALEIVQRWLYQKAEAF